MRLRALPLVALLLLAALAAQAHAAAAPPLPDPARQAIQAYFNELASGDGKDACQQMTEQLQGQIYDQHSVPCQKLFSYVPWSASDKATKAVLIHVYKAARQEAFDNDPEGTFHAGGAVELKQIRIQASRILGSTPVVVASESACLTHPAQTTVCIDPQTTKTRLVLWAHAKEGAVWRLLATPQWNVLPVPTMVKRGHYKPPTPQLYITTVAGPNYGTTPPKDPNDMTITAVSTNLIGFRNYDQYVTATFNYVAGQWWMATSLTVLYGQG